jgi:putative transposase
MFASKIKKRRIHNRCYSPWRWHLDEVFVRINSETHYLWRAVYHEGEVLEVFATKRRDRKAVLRFLKRAMKRFGRPHSIVTDCLRSYRAAMNVIGNAYVQETGRWLNNRAENSHQPFRRREGVMSNFRDIKTLQKFASVHASIHNHFNHERHLNRRSNFKELRAAALGEWCQLAA